jgi:hypothetical protein
MKAPSPDEKRVVIQRIVGGNQRTYEEEKMRDLYP